MYLRSLSSAELHGGGGDRGDGGLCSANVLRPAASPFISLRKAHHRRDGRACAPVRVPTAVPVSEAPGSPRSEIKEEAKPGDIRGGGHPVASAHTQRVSAKRFARAAEQST